MGEYAIRKSDQQEIKIGTCELMYYLRFEDRDKVRHKSGNVDPMTTEGLFYRLPFSDEDHLEPGDYQPFQRGERLYKMSEEFTDEATVETPGLIQLSHDNGLLLNVQCYHGNKLPEGGQDIKAHWNGKSWSLELVFLKAIKEGKEWKVLPVVHCRHCRSMWRYTWEELLPWIPEPMNSRVKHYADKPV